jgi:hypothetical protein
MIYLVFVLVCESEIMWCLECPVLVFFPGAVNIVRKLGNLHIIFNQKNDGLKMMTYHYWKSRLCRGPQTLGKGPQTLGNAFAESSTQQRADGKFFLGHDSLPSTLALGSRHRLCREPTVGRRPKKVAVNRG